MVNAPLVRAGAYLFASLAAMMLGGMFPKPFAELTHFSVVLVLVLIEMLVYRKKSAPAFSVLPPKGSTSTLLLLPVFFALTLGFNLLSSHVTASLGGTIPSYTPSIALFVGAVILAPLTEELLFRGLLLHLFTPYGQRTAILLSSLLFALAHGNFPQMPHALIAGALLAYAAISGKSVLYPILFHTVYNLFVFFDGVFSPLWLLVISSALALVCAAILIARRLLCRLEKGEKPRLRQTWLLLLYAAEMLYLSVLRLL